MSTPNWPYQRARPSGFVDTVDVPSAAELTAMDEALSRAANGEWWSDVALVRNFELATTIDTANRLNIGLVYDPVTRGWYAIGADSPFSDTKMQKSLDHGRTWVNVSVAGGGNPTCFATDGLGKVAYGRSSSNRVVYSDNGFTTQITGSNIGVATGVSVMALHYSPRLAKWFCSLDNGEIWTTTDITPAGTWVKIQVALGGASYFAQFIEGADRVMWIASDSSSGHLIFTTQNGTTLVSVPNPAGLSTGDERPSGCYLSGPAPGFLLHWELASGTASRSAFSANGGQTWTVNSVKQPGRKAESPVYGGQVMVALGRMAVLAGQNGPSATATRVDFYFTIDQGQNWQGSDSLPVNEFSTVMIAYGGGQFMGMVRAGGGGPRPFRGIRVGL
jgi:hypothetical protein